ncbi:hypothetical protein CHMI_03623 [Cellulomonas hominis]|nr:hypothetical protein CHMI_03623 [Cellulomonas hominis]
MAAAYGMDGWPIGAVVAALFGIVMARSHLLYWLGRGVFSGAARLADRAPGAPSEDPATGPEPATAADPSRRRAAARSQVQRLMRTGTARRGLALVHRWGPLAVTFAYLTVGLQSAVFVGSGLVRMPYLRFTVASVPGSVAWAVIWGTVGFAAVWAGVRLATASPWALAGVVVALAALVTWRVLRRRPPVHGPAGPDADRDRTADELV